MWFITQLILINSNWKPSEASSLNGEANGLDILLDVEQFNYAFRQANAAGIINYRFLTTETNLKALYIFRCLLTTSSVKLFVVNVQIFVNNCVFQKKEKPLTFWKWKQISKKNHILEMKAHSKTKLTVLIHVLCW